MNSLTRYNPVKHTMKCLISSFLLSMAMIGYNNAHATTQLIMLEEEGCVYCAKFNREIGPVYPKTTEGKVAPLRRLDLHAQWPDDLKEVLSDTVTPTFILVHDAQEVGRLRGYQGDEFFWFLLNELLVKLPEKSTD